MDGNPRGFNIASSHERERDSSGADTGLPRDGGFGQVPTVFGSFGNTDDLPPPFGHFEIEEFNSPPVVESADTGPFFHNHMIPDLESASSVLRLAAFKSSLVPTLDPRRHQRRSQRSRGPGDRRVPARLNALENIRSSIDVAERGRTMTRVADLRDLGTPVVGRNRGCVGSPVQGRTGREPANQRFAPREQDWSLPGWRSKWRSTCRVGSAIENLLRSPSRNFAAHGQPSRTLSTLPASFRH